MRSASPVRRRGSKSCAPKRAWHDDGLNNLRAIMKSERVPFSTADRDIQATSDSFVKPPFGYYGAKQRIASQIVTSLPPHNAWVEAFCGSAAITLAKNPSPIEIINDLDGEVIN